MTPDLITLVRARDRAEMVRVLGREPQGPVCIAPLIDPAEWGKCWGRTTYDHIKAEPRMGVRAESDAERLASICQGHTEDGMKAGYQWNTSKRPELREYLRRVSR